jgi:ribosomal protein S12 methylthiotransferase
MIKRGTKIISLGGENLTQYGIDLYNKKRIHEFIHELSKVDGLEMINVLELVPGDMYPELIDEIINNPKVVSTSFQIETASDRLLKLMNRNYNLEQYDYYAKIIREHSKSITTLLIGGFPTETEEDMNCTLNYLMDRKIIVAGVCPYSDFEYIPSHKLEQLTKSEIRKHTYYFVKAIREINKRIYLEELPKQNKLIYYECFNNTKYFYSSIPTIIATSDSKTYENLNPGEIITTTPKRLVKRDRIGREYRYKL